MALQKPQLKKNMQGAVMGGRFRPFRKDKGYEGFLAGDWDSPEEKRERKLKNDRLEMERYEKRIERELENDLRESASVRQSLSQFVKKAGGLHFNEKTTSKAISGELRRLSFKESGKRGIAHAKGKKTPDRMRELADEAGFPGMNTEHDFLAALEKDLTGRKKIYATAEGGSNYKRNPDLQAQVEGLLRIGFKTQPVLKIGKQYEKNLLVAESKGLCQVKRENGQLLAVKLKGNPRRRSAQQQPGLDFSGGNVFPTITKSAQQIARYTNLKPDGYNEEGERILKDLNTGYRYIVRNPKKKNMISVSKTQTARASKALAAALLKSPAKTLEALKKVSAAKPAARKNPAPKPNGIVSRYLGRRRAGKEYKKQLKLESRISRSKARQSAAERKAKENPAVKINPAKVVTMGGKYRVKLSDGKFLKLMNQIWETRSKARAQEIAAKARIASDAELKWLDSLKPGMKKNPFSSTFFNIAGGLASALHVHKILTEKKPARRPIPTKVPKANPVKVSATKKNPVKIPTRRTYEMFQGRPATSAQQMPVSPHAPARLDQLGDLIEVQTLDGARYNFAHMKNNPFRLCANTQGKRLWIAGGKFAKANPQLKAHQLDVIGEIDHVIYSTHKPHHGDYDQTHYIHALGEETGERPYLAIDRDGYPVIHGGAYTIEARGIVN